MIGNLISNTIGRVLRDTKKINKVRKNITEVFNFPSDLLVDKRGRTDRVELFIDANKYRKLLRSSGFSASEIKIIEKEKVLFRDLCKKIVEEYMENNPEVSTVIVNNDQKG